MSTSDCRLNLSNSSRRRRLGRQFRLKSTPATYFHHAFRRRLTLLTLLAALVSHVGAAPVEETSAAEGGAIKSIDVGIADHFKIGTWTQVRITVDGAAPLDHGQVQVMVPDSDGVMTIATSPISRVGGPSETRDAVVYTKIGRKTAPIQVTLMDGGKVAEEVTVRSGMEPRFSGRPIETPATGELLAVLSSGPFDLTQAYKEQHAADGGIVKRSVAVRSASELPMDWFGYDGVDVLIMAVDEGSLWQELSADRGRLTAIERWVELGGRLVLLCGGESAQAAFGEGGGLATLLPGKFAEVVRLPETGRLEQYANSESPIGAGGRMAIRVPRLTDVDGNIEVYAGQRPSDLPLVVRSARGLGEIAFVGLDFAKPPLVDWPGRAAFLQAVLRPYVANDGARSTSQTLVTRGYNDLSGALRQAMGRSFPGLSPVSFSAVTVLALAYLLVLGPLDYFLVHRWLRRPMMAWVTFPLIVLLFTGAALAFTDWRQGDVGLRVNRREVVDCDTISGRARGTFWSTIFTTEAARLDLRCDVNALPRGGEPEVLLSAWGLPGGGIGGMQSGGMDLGIVRDAYRYTSSRDGLENVPVLTSATKSFLARWTAPIERPMIAELADVDGLVAGTVENRTGKKLRNVRLLYGEWGYRLGEIADGERVDVSDELSPLRVKTIVTRSAIGKIASSDEDAIVFSPGDAGPDGILDLMMFYEAGGGRGFAQMSNRYQSDIDLSRLLELGRAIVVADVDSGGSQLIDAENGQKLGKADSSEVVYRFVLPVRK
jgi:hypothetical protein